MRITVFWHWALVLLIVFGVGGFVLFRPKAPLEPVKIYKVTQPQASKAQKTQPSPPTAETAQPSCGFLCYNQNTPRIPNS